MLAVTAAMMCAAGAAKAYADVTTESDSIVAVTADESVKAVKVSDDVKVYNNMLSKSGGSWHFNFLPMVPARHQDEDSSASGMEAAAHIDTDVRTNQSGGCEVNTGCNKGYLGVVMLRGAEGVDLNPSGSFMFGFSVWDLRAYNSHRTFGVEASIDILWTRLAVKDGNVIHRNADGILVCDRYQHPEGRSYSRSRMTYASWNLPVTLNWRIGGSKIYAGVEGELRHHLRSRIKVDKNKKYYADSHDMNVNPWGVNAVAGVGGKAGGVFMRMALTDLFVADKSELRGAPLSVGLVFGL